jgi:hypothetical protein
MPTVLQVGPYRVFFYSADANEAPHVHVERDDNTAKFWLEPLRLQRSRGFKPVELNRIERILEKKLEELLESWDEFFG